MKIFITIDVYLPGYRFGGPVRSIANLVDWLGASHEIYVFTRDRDLGDSQVYDSVQVDQWNALPGASVYYASPEYFNVAQARAMIQELAPDAVYLNGFWEAMSRGLLKQRVDGVHYVLAPRGALGAGALRIKRFKKMLGLWLLRPRLRGVSWHATGNEEADEIRATIDPNAKIYTVPNLMKRMDGNSPVPRQHGDVKRVVAFSRISRKKNFKFLLNILKQVSEPFDLDIIGPEEDADYAEELKGIASHLAENQRVSFLGPMAPEVLSLELPKYDFFMLPTQHENFGHVFVEAWAAGLPVVISDCTPWRDLEEKGIGWDLSLDDESRWIEVIRECLQMPDEQLQKMRQASLDFVKDLVDRQPIDAYEKMFRGK